MVGTISHPLNLPIFDAAAGRVVDGHAILQPRVTPTLAETGWGTLFQVVFSGPRGIDPYAFAVSDVYQDLFGEGIYTGKGIYDVDVFERALDERVPAEHPALARSLRGPLRPGRIRLRRRALRGISRPLRGGRVAPAPMGSGGLAAAALESGTRPERQAGRPASFRSWGVGRCSTTFAAAFRRPRCSRPWWPRGACPTSIRGCGRSSCSWFSRSRRCCPSSRASFRTAGASPSGASCAASSRTWPSASRSRLSGSSSSRTRPGFGWTRSRGLSGD